MIFSALRHFLPQTLIYVDGDPAFTYWETFCDALRKIEKKRGAFALVTPADDGNVRKMAVQWARDMAFGLVEGHPSEPLYGRPSADFMDQGLSNLELAGAVMFAPTQAQKNLSTRLGQRGVKTWLAA